MLIENGFSKTFNSPFSDLYSKLYKLSPQDFNIDLNHLPPLEEITEEANKLDQMAISWLGKYTYFEERQESLRLRSKQGCCGQFVCHSWPQFNDSAKRLMSDYSLFMGVLDDSFDGHVETFSTDKAKEAFKDFHQYTYNVRNHTFLNGNGISLPLSDVINRLVNQKGDPAWLKIWAEDFQLWLMAVKNERELRQKNSFVDPMIIRTAKPLVSHMAPYMDLAGFLANISTEVLQNRAITQLREYASYVVHWPTDILSSADEGPGDLNLVHSLANFREISFQEALQLVVHTTNDALNRYNELRDWIQNDDQTSEDVQIYSNIIHQTVVGVLAWSWITPRYGERQLN